MCLNFNDHFKTSRYSYRPTYMNPMVTKNQKHMIDTQKLKNKEHKHTTKETKENYQATREETKKKKRRRNEQTTTQPTRKHLTEKLKLTFWPTQYIPINNYLNVSGLNAPIKDIGWLIGFKNKNHLYVVYKRHHLKTHTD